MKIELTEPLAHAIIDMDDISFSEGLGPKNKVSIGAWITLLRMAENLIGRKAVSTD